LGPSLLLENHDVMRLSKAIVAAVGIICPPNRQKAGAQFRRGNRGPYGLPQTQADALNFLGWALGRSGEIIEGIARLNQGVGMLSQMGARAYLPRSLCLMGQILSEAGRYAEGLEKVARALDLAGQIDDQWYMSRLHQVRAELLLHAHGP